MLPENSKRQNVSDGESFPVDRLSNLPDIVQSHILSFLPTTKEAFKTSILSKTWKNVWTNVDNLIFDNPRCLVKDMMIYKRFVSNVVEAHKGSIKNFTLCGTHRNRGCNELDVAELINTATSRGVERLHVDINFLKGRPRPPWPLSMLSCETLVDLKIWGLYNVSLDIPSTPIFPCLKKLDVGYCDSLFFKNIVARCSALEDLTVSIDGASIDIVSASVKRLEICSSYGYPDGHKIVLRVPSLRYLKFHSELPLEFIVADQLSSLNEADINVQVYNSIYSEETNAKQTCESFERFIQTMSNVRSLRVDLCTNMFIDSVGAGLFVNLKKLEIVSYYFQWRLILSFMESSINLEAITLRKDSTPNKEKLDWKEPKKVPTCLSSSLKKISMDGYSEDELPMVKYIMRTAQVLEQVDIKCATCYGGRNDLKPTMLQKSNMLQNLQKLHKACERCEIFLL